MLAPSARGDGLALANSRLRECQLSVLQACEAQAAQEFATGKPHDFVPLSNIGAELRFGMIPLRHERGATPITGNMAFAAQRAHHARATPGPTLIRR